MATLDFFVENIKCGGCMNSIKTALFKLEGIENVNIEKEENHIQVLGENLPARELIASALDKMGYPEMGNNNLLKSAKSFVSCAIGRITPEHETAKEN
ncbi:MAG: heavy-metal-associated domain-containing protein [Bacteroidia bacterium]